MKGLRNYMETNIQELQEAVENRLEVKLGDIEVKASSQLAYDKFDLLSEEIMQKKREGEFQRNVLTDSKKPLISEINDFFVQAHINSKFPNNIYCNDNFFIKFFYGDKSLMCTSLHELSHLVHLNIVGRESFNNSSNELAEGFAEYMARDIMKNDFGIANYRGPKEFSSYCENFKEEVEKNNLKTADDFKNYLLNHK